MPSDRPTTSELLEAVTEFLQEKVIPQVDRATAFHSKVAINVLNIVAREIQHSDTFLTQECERLISLLTPLNIADLDMEKVTVDELNHALCRAIENNLIDMEDRNLADHLWLSVMDKLKIDNPKYATYVKAKSL